jgi:hypothetical protein
MSPPATASRSCSDNSPAAEDCAAPNSSAVNGMPSSTERGATFPDDVLVNAGNAATEIWLRGNAILEFLNVFDAHGILLW